MALRPRKLQKTVNDQQKYAFKKIADFEHAHVVVLAQEHYQALTEQNDTLKALLSEIRLLNERIEETFETRIDINDIKEQ